MKEERLYNIDIVSLRNGKHDFEYEIDDRFFAAMQDSLVEKGTLKVKVELQKSENMIVLQFDTKGEITLLCDRSLEEFQFPIDAQNRLVFKFGEAFKEISEELIVLSTGTATINLFQYIYEFIAVQVPFKKIHPKFETEDSEEDVLIYGEVHDYFDDEEDASETMDSEEETNSTNEPIDPRFAALLKLKNNNLQ
ncbi:MAG: hypothetical protein RL060_1462 [Bacteroidota bacterium]